MRAFPFAGETHPPTPAQRDAILRETHTLIEAGAGSGKTSTLVDKIAYLLGAERFEGVRIAEPCELHEIAAITFTNASAADFKRKLRAKLAQVADFHAARQEPAAEQRWRARVHEVDRARIGTIHSFCGSILREFGLRVGLDPRFAILDEGEAALLRDECVREVLRSGLEADDGDAVELCAAFGVNAAERRLKDLLRAGDRLEPVHAAWIARSDAVTRQREVVEQLRASLPEQALEKILPWDDARDARAAQVGAAALVLARAAYARLIERMERESLIDYDALVTRTLAVLRARPDVLAALRRRLRWLFIDEFQDTDPDQLAIAELIAGLDASTAEERSLAPRLCIVGDPKQSIYRFRGADVTVWRAVVERFGGLGIRPVPLAKNFRSRSPIVGFVNATFDGLIGTARPVVMEAGQEVDFVALEPHHLSDAEEAVELLVAAGDAGGSADEQRVVEARCIAARLFALREQAGVAWRDVAILFRTRSPMAVMEEELRALGVPCYVAGGSGFFARREVRDVRVLLAAIADPGDDLAWLGVLRSPFVGITDAAIWQARATSPTLPLSALVMDGSAPGLDLARAWLPPLVALRDRVGVAELIELAVERSGYAAQLLTRAGGRLALANLRKLTRLADGRAGETIVEFLTWMEQREDGDARDGDAALYTAGEDVVTLSTVHGAKGLEWPVVVLADLGREIGTRRPPPDVIADARRGIAVKLRDGGEHPPALWGCLAAHDKLLERSEEKRLWYVAATRARSRLVICASPAQVTEAAASPDADADAKKVAHWVLRALRPGGADSFQYVHGDTTWTAPAVQVAPREEAARQPLVLPSLAPGAIPPSPALAARLRPVIAPAVLPRRSATELMALARGESAWRARYAGAGVRGQVRDIPARVIGDVVHGALEQVRDTRDLLEYLEAELVSRSGEARASAAVQRAAAHARALVERAREHPDVVRFTAAGGEHELSFTWFARSATGVHHVRGAMDLVAVVDGVPEILDFKSTAIDPGGEREAAVPYRIQRDTYAAALHTLLGVAPARFTFVFPATGTTHVDDLDPAALERGRAGVHALLDGAMAATGGN